MIQRIPIRFAVLALAALGASPTLRAQEAPPPPLPLGEVAFPDFDERTLSNGARLLVVPQDEVPFITVNLVVPGGAIADPDGGEGVAGFVAQLLTRGTASRDKDEIAGAIDFLGATLGATASDEWTTVSLGLLTPALEQGLELMADVVMNPVFPEDEFELLRTQTLSGLQVQLSDPASLASRAFTRAVYGGHRYGRLVTPASVEALDRAAVEAYHGSWFRPNGALFVVAGDVSADVIADRLEQAFRGWDPGPVPEVTYGSAPERVQPEVVIVHRPGAVQSEIRAGHLLPEGGIEGWTALSVANHVLGARPSSRLNRILREERGYTYSALSGVSRRRDRGVFQASLAVRTEVTGEAIEGLLELIGDLRDTTVPADELAGAKDFLVGSFPLQIETPQQVAAQVTTNRLLGLDTDALLTYRERVSALAPTAVTEAARTHLKPQELVIVVAGDATLIRSQLTGLGHVTLQDAEGNPLTLGDLAPQGASHSFDASSLAPSSMLYNVVVQGTQVGTAAREVTLPSPGLVAFGSRVEAGPQVIVQEVVFTEAFELVSATNDITAQGQSFGLTAQLADGRITGDVNLPGRQQPLDMSAPEGVVVSDMIEVALWLAELEEGLEIRLPVASLQTGTVENVTLRVVGRESVTVPAGTFDTFRVEMSGAEAQTFWVRTDAPRVAVRIQAQAQPIVLELASEGGG